jgi:hypothetical protein
MCHHGCTQYALINACASRKGGCNIEALTLFVPATLRSTPHEFHADIRHIHDSLPVRIDGVSPVLHMTMISVMSSNTIGYRLLFRGETSDGFISNDLEHALVFCRHQEGAVEARGTKQAI